MPRRREVPGLVPRGAMVGAFAVVAVATYLPLLAVLAGGVEGGVAGVLAQATSVVADARRRALLVRSLVIAGGATLAAVGLGAPVALLLHRSGSRARIALGGALLLPLMIPTYVFALGWQHLFDPGGPWVRLAEALGSADPWVPDLATPAGVVAVLALRYLPLVIVGVVAGLARIEPTLEEVAGLVHRTPWILTRVVLPLAWPEVVASALVVFNLALVNYTVPSLLRVPTFPVEIFAAFSGLLEVETAVALSLPLLALGGLSVVLARITVGRRPIAVAARRPASPPGGSAVGRTAAWAVGGVVVGLAVVAPVVGVAGMAGTPGAVAEAYGLAAPQLWRTVGWAAVAATLLAAHGLAAGHLVARSRSLLAELAFLLPLALPPTVLGIGMIQLWNRPYLAAALETTAVLLLAYAGQFVPFSAIPTSASLAAVPRELEEAAVLSGMGWLARVRRVLLPLAWRGVAVGWVLTFALCLDEIGASILVQPPDGETLAVRIYNLSHYGAAETVGALCLLVLAIVAVPLLTLGLVAARRPDARRPVRA